MCGILGSFQRQPEINFAQRFERAMQMLQRRGPDGRVVQNYSVAGGELVFGHARLSILDLSARGTQPMQGSDGRYVIVFNGEIYNYRELRQTLHALGHRFISDSDTEVLLAAWEVWGEACLPRLTGMFAFAVLDRTTATLTCARDAFGVKPFFYAETAGEFLFASEAPALIALRRGKASLNWQRAYDYLVHGDYDSSSDSFFDGVMQLPRGICWLSIWLCARLAHRGAGGRRGLPNAAT